MENPARAVLAIDGDSTIPCGQFCNRVIKRVTCSSCLCLFKKQARGAVKLVTKGECEMMPKSLAAWCTALFFLWYGLGVFVGALMAPPIIYIGGLLALGVAIFTFLGR